MASPLSPLIDCGSCVHGGPGLFRGLLHLSGALNFTWHYEDHLATLRATLAPSPQAIHFIKATQWPPFVKCCRKPQTANERRGKSQSQQRR